MQDPPVQARLRASRRGARRWALPGLGVALVLLLLLAYLVVPRTVVVLNPRTQPLAGTVDVLVVGDGRATGSGPRVLGRSLVTAIEVVEQAPTGGRQPAPGARANGNATFVNRHGGPATVPAGTQIMTPSGARFLTQAELTLDPAVGATARVPIEAMEPGDVGNVARLEINRILGPLGAQLAVLNEEPTSGGGQSSTPMVRLEDVERVKAIATERASSDGLRALRADLRPGELLLAETLKVELLEEQREGAVGEPLAAVGYRARTRVSATAYPEADLKQEAERAWRPPVPTGFFLPPGQVRAAAPEVAAVEGPSATVRVRLEAIAVADMDANRVRESARWRPPDEVRRELARTLPLEAEPRVRVEPPWAGRALRVAVVLDLNSAAPRA